MARLPVFLTVTWLLASYAQAYGDKIFIGGALPLRVAGIGTVTARYRES